MSEEKRTVGRWSLDDPENPAFIVADGHQICQFFDKHEHDFENYPGNAAFIIRACNNYDELVTALLAARSELAFLLKAYERSPGDIRSVVDEALAKAKAQ